MCNHSCRRYYGRRKWSQKRRKWSRDWLIKKGKPKEVTLTSYPSEVFPFIKKQELSLFVKLFHMDPESKEPFWIQFRRILFASSIQNSYSWTYALADPTWRNLCHHLWSNASLYKYLLIISNFSFIFKSMIYMLYTCLFYT